MELRTKPFDAAGHLKSEEDIAAYLTEAFSEGDPAFIALALGTVARALGMSKIAQAAGMPCEELSEALSANGDPALSTLVNATRAMGFEITIKPRAA